MENDLLYITQYLPKWPYVNNLEFKNVYSLYEYMKKLEERGYKLTLSLHVSVKKEKEK